MLAKQRYIKPLVAYVIYDVLVDVCDAPEPYRSTFVQTVTSQDRLEWRFQGALGFGGKFYSDTWRVSCYREDESPLIVMKIDRANVRLARLKELVDGL